MNRSKPIALALLLLSFASLDASAAIIRFLASGTMNTTRFDPTLISAPANGTPWLVSVITNDLVPDIDPDPNAGSYYLLEGTMRVGSDEFNLTQFPVLTRLINVFNSTGGTTNKDRAYLQVFSDVSAPTIPSIGPNAIANFFVALESPDDQLVADDSLTGLIGLTVSDLCAGPPCSAVTGSRFGIQLFQPGVAGPFTVRGDLEFLSITVIPVPQALLLFGSALGILGWTGRKPMP